MIRYCTCRLTLRIQSKKGLRTVLVPGFISNSELADFDFKATVNYAPSHGPCLDRNNPQTSIQWPDIGKADLLLDKDMSNKFSI